MKKEWKKAAIVTDSPRVIASLQCVLKREGMLLVQVCSALDLALCMQDLKSLAELDLIVIDLSWPPLRGFKLLWLVKNDAELAKTPVLIIASNFGADEIMRGYNLKADYILPTPFTAKQFRFGMQLIFEDGEEKPKRIVVLEDLEGPPAKPFGFTGERFRLLSVAGGRQS